MNFSSKSFKPRPPDKGSFPLDHFGEKEKGQIVCTHDIILVTNAATFMSIVVYFFRRMHGL